MKYLCFTVFLWCLISSAQAQQIQMKLSFKHIDCGVRRGFSCKEVASTPSTKTATSYNSTYILGKEVLILRIHRDQITAADEIQLFGRRITKRNQKDLRFVLPQPEEIDTDLIDIIDQDLKLLYPVLEAKPYLTLITKNYIEITLIDMRQ